MKIKSFSNRDGHLCFLDEEGNVVDISGWNTSEAHNYEKKNNVKVRDIVKEFCVNVDPRSKEIFEFIDKLSQEYNTAFGFDSGDVGGSNIILSCFINYPESSYDLNVRLIYDKTYNKLTPSIEFLYGSRGDSFGFNVFKHFSYENLALFYHYIATYLSDKTEDMLKDIMKNIYESL